MRYLSVLLLLSCITINAHAQVVLSANGEGNTYDLINNTLAAGYTAVETPDCGHSEFGDHIDEVWDDELDAYVFRFHIHVTPDNDRCKNYDRQRNEIKTYDKSPDNLKAISGETVTYKWLFKIDDGFQPSPSFTHLHQLKAVGGSEESMPLITLTARKGSSNKLELRYAENTTQETIHQVNLSEFTGEWVEVHELVTFGENGSYDLEIVRLSDQETIMEYHNSDIRMWKTDAEFMRPKWGIYRSLNNADDLRDEIILFNDFSIKEELPTNMSSIVKSQPLKLYPNPCASSFQIDFRTAADINNIKIYNTSGELMKTINKAYSKPIDVSYLKTGMYLLSVHFKNNASKSVCFVKKSGL